MYSRIVNDPSFVDGYSGLARDISRLGFNSGETDLGGIGYQNNWLTFQLGRGKQSWGAGNGIQLALSHSSLSYDYGFSYDCNYKNHKCKCGSKKCVGFIVREGSRWRLKKRINI